VPTPLEGQILDDFARRLAASEAVPEELAQKLMGLTRSDHLTAAETLLETIKTNVGDQSV
jgi:hypothetical protein